MKEIQIPSLGQEDPLEEEIATRSSILGWEIPWTEEPGGWATIQWTSEVAQSCSPLCDPMDCSPGIDPGLPHCGRHFTIWATREAKGLKESNTTDWAHTHTHLLKRSDIGFLQVSDQNGEFRWHQPHGLTWQTGALKGQRSFMIEKSAPDGWGNFSISILLENKQTNKFLIVL